jgi:hypothetical protein
MHGMTAWFRLNPLAGILLIGLAFRLGAALNAPGYLMHDDHFLVIETSASWAEGEDYNNWMPWTQRDQGIASPKPHQANLAYPGVISGIFRVLLAVGIVAPTTQMLIIRLLHGLFSLLIVAFGYKIAEALGGRKSAVWAGLALAGFAWFPHLGVRQLVEVVCIPPLMWSAWVVIQKPQMERSWRTWFVAGIGLGLATTLRYQAGIFGIGWAIAIAWVNYSSNQKVSKTVSEIGILSFSSLLFFSIGQIQDVFIWGEPFAQLRAYIEYNSTHSSGYPQGFWHQYIWVILGLLIPPFSFAWAIGMGAIVRKHAMLVLPPLVFFVFHSYFPNKQERFILPMVPFVIVAGSVGWMAFSEQSSFWKKRRTLERRSALFFISINLVIGLVFCGVQPKKSRIESMTALYNRGDLTNFLIVHTDKPAMPPQFYSGSWEKYWSSDLKTNEVNHRQVMCNSPSRSFPNYIVFSGSQHLGEGVERYKASYSSMKYIEQVPPGRWDRLLSWLNPINSAERMMIYAIDPLAECGASTASISQ